MTSGGPPNFYIDMKHNLGYCEQHKVGSSTWTSHFLKLMPEKLRPKSIVGHWDETMEAYYKKPFAWARDQYKTQWQLKNWFLSFVKNKKIMLFSFVRHPFERLVSAYKDKFLKHESKGHNFVRYRSWYHKDHSFSSFANLVLMEYNKYIRNEGRVNGHWLPMTLKCWYCDAHYDVVGRMETFSEDVKYIIVKNKLGMLSVDTQVRSTGHSPKEDALKYFSTLTKHQIRSLYEMYKIDFEIFNYKVDDYIKL